MVLLNKYKKNSQFINHHTATLVPLPKFLLACQRTWFVPVDRIGSGFESSTFMGYVLYIIVCQWQSFNPLVFYEFVYCRSTIRPPEVRTYTRIDNSINMVAKNHPFYGSSKRGRNVGFHDDLILYARSFVISRANPFDRVVFDARFPVRHDDDASFDNARRNR